MLTETMFMPMSTKHIVGRCFQIHPFTQSMETRPYHRPASLNTIRIRRQVKRLDQELRDKRF